MTLRQENKIPSLFNVSLSGKRILADTFPALESFLMRRRALRRLSNHERVPQSNECQLIARLVSAVNPSRVFCEFGFGAHEFNCAGLCIGNQWQGLLIDADVRQVDAIRWVLCKQGITRVAAVSEFLNADNVVATVTENLRAAPLGVLSIDVDGNDLWLLQKLAALQPQIICVEYNASLGLRPISVPYDPLFNRHRMHPSGWYHGASLAALHILCVPEGYSLVAVSDAGINAFFVRTEFLPRSLATHTPEELYRENQLRNHWARNTADQQWDSIKHLAFHEIQDRD